MKNNLFCFSESEVKHNARVKYYINPDGSSYPVELMVCNNSIFIEEGFERRFLNRKTSTNTKKPNNSSIEQAVNRARKNLYDLIRCNNFKWFVTLTFNDEIVERSNYNAVVKKFNQWTSNRVKRNGLCYVAVIERHHKSNGLHFHVLTNEVVTLSDSGTVKCHGRKKPIKASTADRYNIPISDRKTVYNISDWSYGFSTAIEITDDEKGEKVAAYLKKYLTKDFEKIGGRYYYSGGLLARPLYTYTDTDFYDIEPTYEFSVAGNAYKVLKL